MARRSASSDKETAPKAITLDQATIAKLAEHLENAELQAFDVTKITDDYPDMDWDDAYAIQDEIKRRKLARGNKVAGLKAGSSTAATATSSSTSRA